MTLELVLPFGEKKSIKNLVFTILTKEYPLKLVELFNLIKKRYGRSVTYQAVRKAVLELVQERVLTEEDKAYAINVAWVRESKVVLDNMLNQLQKGSSKRKEESLGGSVTVYDFPSVHAMMQFWEELIENWIDNFKVGDTNTNFYQAHHGWEGLSHLASEQRVMNRVINKGIRSTTLFTANTPLDRSVKNFYASIGVKTYLRLSNSNFDKGYHVGTYGDLVVHTTLPPAIISAIDSFFHKHKSIETLNLNELSKIVNSKIPVKLTVIKNAEMAKHINQSILAQIKD